MLYKYIAVFRIIGVSLPLDSDDIVLEDDSSAGEKIVLSSNSDRHSSVIDRGLIVGTLMLKGLIGEGGEAPLEDRLVNEMRQLQAKRSRQHGAGPFLVIKFSQDTPVNISGELHDFGEFAVVFDAIDGQQIKNRHQQRINQVLTSFFLATERDYEMDKVTDGVYLLENGKIYYSYTLTSSVRAVVSQQLNDTQIAKFIEYLEALSDTLDFDKINRLLTRALTEYDDKLRAFLFAWTALEIFINKLFKEYEQKFFVETTINELSPSTKKFFDRIKEVMKDKYRLRDKFFALSALLSDSADKDIEEFVAVKAARDNLIHGQEVEENTLPTQIAVSLLKKYIKLHLRAINTPSYNSVHAVPKIE